MNNDKRPQITMHRTTKEHTPFLEISINKYYSYGQRRKKQTRYPRQKKSQKIKIALEIHI